MDEQHVSLSQQSEDEENLSVEDLAVLQAFDSMEIWNTEPISSNATYIQDTLDSSSDDMLLLFASEAEEDIALMRRALNQLEQGDSLDPTRFTTVRRVAHKICGTAGAMECHVMATIAHYIENIVEHITGKTLFPLIGLNALVQSVFALEQTLESVVTTGQESDMPLVELEGKLEQFNVAAQASESPPSRAHLITTPLPEPIKVTGVNKEMDTAFGTSRDALPEEDPLSPFSSSHPFIHVDARRFEHLIRHSEQLVELRTPLENAQAQVEAALQELHGAQVRLQQLEASLAALSSNSKPVYPTINHPASSLVARILSAASQRNNAASPHKIRTRPRLLKVNDMTSWDELNLERYTERDMMVRSMSEAIADVTLASSRVRIAYAHLNHITQRYVTRTASMRNDMLILRLAPLSVLVPRLQQVIEASAMGQAQQVRFEVVGEAVEIDQDILETLAIPLLHLLRTCITDTFSTQDEPIHAPHRVWLYAESIGNEITLELGFSMTVQGGALEVVRESIQRLKGSISLQRNNAGGVSFSLRLPRSQGPLHCLLVRVGKQHVVVPFSQVKRIGDERQEELDIVYHLSKLLDFPTEADARKRITAVLVLSQGASRMAAGVVVDDVVGDIEAVVKPLASHLQRPGISSSVIDGKGNVLLLLDMPELIKYYNTTRRHSIARDRDNNGALRRENTSPRILIADDSVYLRQSLLLMLEHAKYITAEAQDGMEALELLTENPPDVFLLDMEMPNLNGYDLLSIMHLYPELNDVKVIVLTSRSSEKHRQRALELGAHAYLTKPCTQETLLETIRKLLRHD